MNNATCYKARQCLFIAVPNPTGIWFSTVFLFGRPKVCANFDLLFLFILNKYHAWFFNHLLINVDVKPVGDQVMHIFFYGVPMLLSRRINASVIIFCISDARYPMIAYGHQSFGTQKKSKNFVYSQQVKRIIYWIIHSLCFLTIFIVI